MDHHNATAAVAAVLAARGFPARVVSQNGDRYAVEVSLDDKTALWSLGEEGWGYVVLVEVGGGFRSESSGRIDFGDEADPERIAFVIANFPYGGEMTDDEVRETVTGLLNQIEGMDDADRQAILDQVIPATEDRPTNSWKALQETGLLWAINRQVFHPMGFSFALRYEDGQPVGWVLLGDGETPVQMERLVDIDGAGRFGSFMQSLAEVVD